MLRQYPAAHSYWRAHSASVGPYGGHYQCHPTLRARHPHTNPACSTIRQNNNISPPAPPPTGGVRGGTVARFPPFAPPNVPPDAPDAFPNVPNGVPNAGSGGFSP
eukprot:1476568-Rhodomonas_salina.2